MRWIQKKLILFWFLLTLLMAYEYWALNHNINFSIISYLKRHFPKLMEANLSTEPGRPISYYLGWAGFCTLLITNIYILRKRLSWMQSWGAAPNWLEFHIFCGLMGPTLIVFHSDFKIGGLVAISFWSMMVVAVSGVLGRYFYLQVLTKSAAHGMEVEKWDRAIGRMLEKSNAEISPERLERMKQKALNYVGAHDKPDTIGVSALLSIIFRSLIGDVRLLFYYPKVSGLHPKAGEVFCGYALAVRKQGYTEPFKKLLGYWHSFHVPFAIIMYITATIHVAVALLFQSE